MYEEDNNLSNSRDIAIGGLTRSCNYCDPTSNINHTIIISRIRIANLCCAGEEKIIRSTLQDTVGIDEIAVNIIGKYAVIKHCPVQCCAPTDHIIRLLNHKHLGASLQDTGSYDDKDNKPQDFLWQIIHIVTVLIFLLIGSIIHLATNSSLVSKIFYLISIIIGVGPVIHAAGIALIVRQSIDIHVLILVAVIGAVASGEYFDGSLVIALFMVAELIESLVMARVRKAVSLSSSGVIPREAYLSDGSKIAVESIIVGHVLAVRTGEMILADGVVVKGECIVDESSLTGESVPIQKKVGDKVSSGTVVQNGYIDVEAKTSAAESTLSLLKQAVLDVQADRGKFGQIVDQFAQFWTPFILLGSIIYLLIFATVYKNWNQATYGALLLLVLACPCAIVIAAPIPSVCAIATAARNGVLIRGSSVVEKMGAINAVAVDKTGTLTKGFFKVCKQLRFNSMNGYDLTNSTVELHGSSCGCCNSYSPVLYYGTKGYDPLQLAAAVEKKSTHPIASAIVSEYLGCIANAADDDAKSLPNVRKVSVLQGIGVSGWVEVENDSKYVIIGNERILARNGGTVKDLPPQQQKVLHDFLNSNSYSSCLLVAVENEITMALSLSDEMRPEATDFVRNLHYLCMPVSMLTGDSRNVAEEVCNEVGIDLNDCFSRLLPTQKQQWIQRQSKINFENIHRDKYVALAARNELKKSFVNALPNKYDRIQRYRDQIISDKSRNYSKILTPGDQDDFLTCVVCNVHTPSTTKISSSLSMSSSGEFSRRLNEKEVANRFSSDVVAATFSPLTSIHSSVASAVTVSNTLPQFEKKEYILADSSEESSVTDGTRLTGEVFNTFISMLRCVKRKRHILMVGDGINDSTALAAATVGVAMGAGGSAMAVSAANVVLITDNLLLIPCTIRYCRKARAVIVQNCLLAIGLKFGAVLLAILGIFLAQYFSDSDLYLCFCCLDICRLFKTLASNPSRHRITYYCCS